jgi:hypothetical protein
VVRLSEAEGDLSLPSSAVIPGRIEDANRARKGDHNHVMAVKPMSAGSGSGMYGTISQIANAAGVAAIGTVFFAIETVTSVRPALYAALLLFALSILLSVAFLSWMRRAGSNAADQG